MSDKLRTLLTDAANPMATANNLIAIKTILMELLAVVEGAHRHLKGGWDVPDDELIDTLAALDKKLELL